MGVCIIVSKTLCLRPSRLQRNPGVFKLNQGHQCSENSSHTLFCTMKLKYPTEDEKFILSSFESRGTLTFKVYLNLAYYPEGMR